MLGKFLITLVVIVIAILVLKQRSQQPENSQNEVKPKADAKVTSEATSDFRVAAYMFLIMMFGAAIILYYQRWQDDHTILTVNLFRSGDADVVSYQVYKYQLDSRTFTTIDGTVINVADSERMEVQGLE